MDSDGLAAASAAGSWISSRQFSNGAFFAESNSALGTGGTAEAVVALVAADGPRDVIGKGLSYAVAQARSEATGPGQVSRLIMALAAGGKNPRDVSGINYVDSLKSFLKPSGAYDENNVYANSVAVLGMVATGESVPAVAIEYIRNNQCAGGGFSWQPGCLRTPDIDTTALTVGAMIASGVPSNDTAVARSRLFLLASQDRSGGFGYEAGKSINSNSTALVLSAIAALKESPRSGQWDLGDGRDPLSALLSMQEPSGAFRYDPSRDDDSRNYATVQAIVGAAGVVLPLRPDSADNPIGGSVKAHTTQPLPATNPPVTSESSSTNSLEPSSSTTASVKMGSTDDLPGKVLGLPVAGSSHSLVEVTAVVLFVVVASATYVLRIRNQL